MISAIAASQPIRRGVVREGPRLQVALFDFADVFEDFYPQLGVDRTAFSTSWAATANHRFASLINEWIGDVTWYALSLEPPSPSATHALGHRVTFARSSLAHRVLWRTFYSRSWSWRLRRCYKAFATLASYLAPLSLDLLRTLKSDRPDILFVQDYSSGRFDVLLAASRWLRAPLVTYHSGSTPDAYVGRSIRKRTLRRADAVLVTSRREADHLSSTFGISPSRCHVVLTPIDMDLFRPIPRPEATVAAGLDEARRYFLFVGRMDDAVKRITNMMRAFADATLGHEDIELIVIGDGPDAEMVRSRGAHLLGDRVRFLGWVPETALLPSFYSSSEALLLPSLREGFPTVVGESLACGTPVIATDVGGISELVEDGVTGRLLPPGDDGALTEAISQVVSHPSRFRAMSENARRAAEERVAPGVVGMSLAAIFNDLERRR